MAPGFLRPQFPPPSETRLEPALLFGLRVGGHEAAARTCLGRRFALSLPPLALVGSASHVSARPAQAALPQTAPSSSGSSSSPSTASSTSPSTTWVQKFVELPSMRRGCHVITRHILKGAPEIQDFSVGLAHIFVMHTSASLTINENASPDVPMDMEDALNRIAPEGDMYRHLDEGADDMPAHVKASLMGSSVSVPIAQGRLALGTWQGIWLHEHRDYGGSRRLVITIQGVRA